MKKLFVRIQGLTVLMMILPLVITGCMLPKEADDSAKTGSVVSDTGSAVSVSEEGEDKLDTSKKVVLKMYLLGDKQEDHDLVWGEINTKLEQNINATIDVNLLGWGEWDQRYPLLFAAGDKFDMIYTANWAKYVDQAVKGGFLPLSEEMLKKYAGNTYTKIPEAAWKQTKIGGKIYMIPGDNVSASAFVIMIRGDLREKYGLPEIKTINDYERFLDTIAENEKGILAYGDNNHSNHWILPSVMVNQLNTWSYINCGGVDMMHFDFGNTDSNPFFRYDTTEYISFVEKMIEWRQKGYWSNTALTESTGRSELFKVGKSASTVENVGSISDIYNDWKAKYPDWKLEVCDAAFGTITTANSYLSDGMAIHATSDNPERALMAIDCMCNDRDINYLVRFGIKGKHYDLTSDGKLIQGADSSKYSQGYSIWQFNVLPLVPKNEEHPSYQEIKKSQSDKMVIHPLSAFVLNTENIKTEYSACKNIFDQYQPILELGFSKEPEKDIREIVDKLNAAGFDKIKQEIEKQVAECIAEFNK